MKFKAGIGPAGEGFAEGQTPDSEVTSRGAPAGKQYHSQTRYCYWSPGTKSHDRRVNLERAFWTDLVSQERFSYDREDIQGPGRREITRLLPFLHPPISPQFLCCSNGSLVNKTFRASHSPPAILEHIRPRARKGSEGKKDWEKLTLTDKVRLALGGHRLSLIISLLTTGRPPS